MSDLPQRRVLTYRQHFFELAEQGRAIDLMLCTIEPGLCEWCGERRPAQNIRWCSRACRAMSERWDRPSPTPREMRDEMVAALAALRRCMDGLDPVHLDRGEHR